MRMLPQSTPDKGYARPLTVVPDVPTVGHFGQHFIRSAVPSGKPPAYGEEHIYLMVGQIQQITAPNISLQGTPGHVAYRGLAGIPTSDLDSCY